MANSARVRRFRGSRKRIERIRFTREDKWFAVFLVLLGLISVALGGWVGFYFSD